MIPVAIRATADCHSYIRIIIHARPTIIFDMFGQRFMIRSFVIAFVLLERLNEVQVVEFDALIGVAFAEKGELRISERDLIVV